VGERILINNEGKEFFLTDLSKDFHTKLGFLKKEDLNKKEGTEITNNYQTEKFTLLDPQFFDKYKRIKRGAQIMITKDIGAIIANTGINNESKVLDAGSGSGALSIFLSKIAKEVTSYEIDDKNIEIVKKNIDYLDIKNLKLKKGDVYEKIDEKDRDVIILDLPEPWKAIKNAKNALKLGGYVVNYSPSINSVMRLMEEVRKEHSENFVIIKTIDLQEVQWKVEEMAVRPLSKGIGHTAFLTFLRRIK